MSAVAGVANGFDLLIESIETETTLMAGLASGPADLGQYRIETLQKGQWAHVAFRVSDLLANPLAGGKGLDPDNVTTLLRIAATDRANGHIQLDNIFPSCALNAYSKNWQWDTSCSIDPLASTK